MQDCYVSSNTQLCFYDPLFFREMSGDTVPSEWVGGMNVNYTFGGTFKTPGWYVILFITCINTVVENVFFFVNHEVYCTVYI